MKVFRLHCFPYFSDHLRDIDHHQAVYLGEQDLVLRKRSLVQIQRGLVKCQELGDEKLQIVSHIMEFIENRSRQLEQDLENLGKEVLTHWPLGDLNKILDK